METMELVLGMIRATGFEPKIQEWKGEQGVVYRNFLVHIPGERPEKVLLGAHYDTFEETPGADDNASAVAVLLGFLNCLKSERFPYDLEVVFYACEEPPFFGTEAMGSFVHAGTCDPAQIRFMVCLEMVGYFSESDHSQDFPLGFLRWIYGNKGNFLMGVSNLKSIQRTAPLLKSLQSIRPQFYRKFWIPFAFSGMDWSDHRSYWNRGIPAVMLTDTAMFRNSNYHGADDTTMTLNYSHMANLVHDLKSALLNMP